MLSIAGNHHRPMTLSQLRYLVAVAEERHFGRAARRCFVSQPTLSAQIRKLEEHLDVVLFERTNKSVDITPLGQAAADRARRVLEEVDTLRELARGARAPLSGCLRMGIIPTLCPYLLPWMLPALGEDYPQLDLQVVEDLTDNVTRMLLRHEVECILVAIPEELPGSIQVPLFDEPFRVACPRGHSLAEADAVSVQELVAENLLYVAEGHCLRDQTIAVCGAEGRRQANRSGAFRGASLETLRRMVAAGMGFTLMPELAVDGTAPEGGVVFRPLQGAAVRRIALVYRESYPLPRDMQLLARTIVSGLPAGVRPAALI